MKLLTLNTHSLVEKNYRRKLGDFLTVTAREAPQVIALQEVNQRQDRAAVENSRLLSAGYVPCDPQAVVRRGNHALAVAEGLRGLGLSYDWTWIPIKRGYGIYDEGVAVFSSTPMEATDTVTVSRTEDSANWKTRKLLGALVDGVWFYSVHLGWWDDPDEPFANQWARVNAHMAHRGAVFLMGDFNSPAEVRGEGYDLVVSDGWQDTHALARDREDFTTVHGRIAGWTQRDLPAAGARVDHIFCNCPYAVRSCRAIFNGENAPVVSDHFGVVAEL